MKKSLGAFYLVAAAILASAAALALVFSAWLLLVAIPLILWWALYFRSLSYSIQGKSILLCSGVLFKKRRIVPLENIQRVMHLRCVFWRNTILSVVYTASGGIVIFAHFSTESL
ncbi:MAG: PH domain-containing protein [Ruminococcaceae bacterium]|nr:PH domain-containing protein [Oscillospiraceae bacterium]